MGGLRVAVIMILFLGALHSTSLVHFRTVDRVSLFLEVNLKHDCGGNSSMVRCEEATSMCPIIRQTLLKPELLFVAGIVLQIIPWLIIILCHFCHEHPSSIFFHDICQILITTTHWSDLYLCFCIMRGGLQFFFSSAFDLGQKMVFLVWTLMLNWHFSASRSKPKCKY